MKKHKIVMLLIAISLFSCIPYLADGVIAGNDTSYHLNRILGLASELQYKNIFGLIHSNLKQGFGYANGIFYPQLFLYIPAVSVALGMDIIVSYKIFIVIITVATSFITYYSVNRFTKSTYKSLLITFLYVLSTYRLGDIYVRSALGEILAFTFLPLVLLGLYEIIYGDSKKWWIICIGIFGIINSHILSALFVLILILMFCLFNCKRLLTDKNRMKNLIIAGVVSILLSVSFILPYVELAKSDTFNFEIYDNAHFLYDGASDLQDLLQEHLSDVGAEFTISLPLIIFPMLLLFCKDFAYKKDRFLIQCYIVGLIFLILSTKLIPWKRLSMFAIIQFPFRFSIIYSLLFAYVAGEAIFRYFKDIKTIKYVIILMIFFVGNQLSTVNVNINDSSYEAMINNYPLGLEEYSPINLDVNTNFIYDIEDELDNEKNKFKREDIPTIDYEKEGPKIEFYYNRDKEINLHIPLIYYKGYVAYIIDENGEKHSLQVKREEKNANIIITSNEIVKGNVVVKYEMTKIQKISYMISFISLVGLIIYIIKEEKYEK